MQTGGEEEKTIKTFSDTLSEPAVVNLSRVRVNRLDPPFALDERFCWKAGLPSDLSSEGDYVDDGYNSHWRLYENGRQIGIPHSLHANIAEDGRGRFSHWKDTLYFSTSDNSDPNTNSRAYELRLEGVAAEPQIDLGQVGEFEWISPVISTPSVTADVSFMADILRRRQVGELVYFHTDHFEPWVGSPEQRIRALVRFAQSTSRSAFGSKLSLFYTPMLQLAMPGEPGGNGAYDCVHGDGVGFRQRSPELVEMCRNLLRPLEAEIGHEFHIHIHHENWTRTDHTNPAAESSAWCNRHSTPEADVRRLDLYLRLSREMLAHDLGRPFDRWAFVHGNWSLNASDTRYCQIENEIELLMRHGCFGDFTFPAPNPNCQPTSIGTPYACLPVSGAKAYDAEAADPRPVSFGSGVIRSDRFFIWNSRLRATDVSLDFFAADTRGKYRDPQPLIGCWLEQSDVLDGTLYLKTHAHSLHPSYQAWEEGQPFPHTHPDIVSAFELLQRACDTAQVPLVFATVNEVMERMQQLDRGEARSADTEPAARRGDTISASRSSRPESLPLTTARASLPNDYLLPKRFANGGGNLWIARLPFEFHDDADWPGDLRRSQWSLYEDGHPLGQAHSQHPEIKEIGGGRYSHWGTGLYFSTSDNSDPNSNGRSYAVQWQGDGTKPLLAALAKLPVAEVLSFGERPNVRRCDGLIAVFGGSFSGSTLLNAVLGAHPLIFGGGELHWLIDDYALSECTVCGGDCRFWTPEIRSSLRREGLYHDVGRLFGRSYVVDISKMTDWYVDTLEHYSDIPIARILMVKHPLRHVASSFKLREQDPRYGDIDLTLGQLREQYEELDWAGKLYVRGGSAGTGRAGVDFVLRYEDFVASPKTALTPILNKLGLEYHERMEHWASAEHHHIGGNIGPVVQIANAMPLLDVSARNYRRRGIFLDNSYLEILPQEEVERILRHPDARWIGEQFGYEEWLPRRDLLSTGAYDDDSAGTDAASEEMEIVELRTPFRSGEGFCWFAELPPGLEAECDDPGHHIRSPWHLREQGVAIGRPHALHREITALGGGRHSHWDDELFFSTSDNSDPNTNGKRYALARLRGRWTETVDPERETSIALAAQQSPGLGADALEANIMVFLREKLGNRYGDETPIEYWYRTMYVERGRGFAPYAQAVVDLAARERSRYDRVTEIGAGSGQNCLQLACQGWHTVAVEAVPETYSWMAGLLDRIDGLDPALAARVTPLRCAYPERSEEYVDRRTLVCFLGLLCEHDDELARRMIETLQHAGGVILDPRVFFRHRERQEERNALIADLKGLGFRDPVLLWDATSEPGFYPYRFLYFERA